MLSKFIRAKEMEIQKLRVLADRGELGEEYPGERADFCRALKRVAPGVIAEYKRKSPSRGVINDSLTPEEAAKTFCASGAAAFSVLTEKEHFGGDLGFLNLFAGLGLPVLRKDFIFHPVQVQETATTPASALLLIVRVVRDLESLSQLVRHCLEYNLEPVVEIFESGELDIARKAGARTILVNNRDLDRLTVDLELSRSLIPGKRPKETWICASGIDNARQVKEFVRLGFDGFLVGTSIMSSSRPGEKLRELCACPEN